MRALQISLLAAAGLWADSVVAADALKFGPPPAWVVPATARAAVPMSEAPIVMLFNDQQVSMEPGHIVTYSQTAMRIQNPQGLAAGNISISWDPATEAVTIHKLQIKRGNKVIDVLASGQTFITLRRETNLDAAMLDGTLTANIQPEGLQVGDIIDMAASNEHSDPVLKGHVEGVYGAWNGVPFASARARLSWPATTQMSTRQSADLPAAKTRSGNTTVLEVTAKDIQPLIAPKGAPPRFRIGRLGEATDFRSWSQVAELFAPLYREAAVIAPSGSLRDELNRIRNSTNDPKSRAGQALQLVQDRTRYVALLMGQGGFVPAAAEETWKRRFGDCKGKTALLLALLHELDIEAEPVLVNSSVGDVIGDRLPMAQLFDHVLVRAHIGGKAYWLDGTRTGDRSLDQIDVPDFGWGLPLVANAELVSIIPPPLDLPAKERTVDIDATVGIYAPTKTTLHELYRGDLAVAMNAVYTQLSAAQRDETLRRLANTYLDDFEVSSSSAQFDRAKRHFNISIEGTVKLSWKDGWFFVPTSSIAFDPDFDRTGSAYRDAPVEVGYPRFIKDVATLHLPAGFAANQNFDSPVNETLAGVEFRRSETVSGDTITVASSERGLVPEVSYKEAVAARARLKTLNDDDVYLRVPDAYQMSAADTRVRLAEAPGSAKEYFERGIRLLNSSNFEAAISDFTESLTRNPKDEWALANRSLAYAWRSNFDAADKDVTAAEALNPANPIALHARGLIAEKRGDHRLAIEVYSAALEKNPNDYWALTHRATARLGAGDDQEALADSDLVLSRDLSVMDLRVLRANIFLLQGKTDDVAREAELLIKDNPKSDYAFVAAGQIYAHIDRRADAMKAFDQALAMKPEAYIYVNRARARPYSDRSGRLADIETALKLEPNNTDALEVKADQLILDGKIADALPLVNQAIKTEPNADYLTAKRAFVLLKLGRTADAQSELQTLRSEAKTASDFNRLCWTMATASASLDAALHDCETALRLDPDHKSAMGSMGLTLLRLGKFDQAITSYDKAIAKHSGSSSYMGRAIAYARKGDAARAASDRAAALKLDEDVEYRFASYGLKL